MSAMKQLYENLSIDVANGRDWVAAIKLQALGFPDIPHQIKVIRLLNMRRRLPQIRRVRSLERSARRARRCN